MRKLAIGLALGAMLLPSVATAQQHPGQGHPQGSNRPQQARPDQHRPQPSRPGQHSSHQNRPGQERPHQSRPMPAPSRPVPSNPNMHQQKPRPNGSNWQNFGNYDYNRPGSGDRKYFADKFYREGTHYKPTKITRNTRIYRGSNGRYYCRRSDGTTGLIAGVAIGGILGNFLGDGDSALLATVLGAGVGGALGREIDRGNVQCR